jgi:hypothetical protein
MHPQTAAWLCYGEHSKLKERGGAHRLLGLELVSVTKIIGA